MAHEITRPKAPPTPRAGTVAVDLAVIGALRTYVRAADAFYAAKQQMERAREALDVAAGGHQEATFNGQTAFRFDPRGRRDCDLDRLAERHKAAYADCVRESATYTLVIDAGWRQRLRQRAWRTAVRTDQAAAR